MRRKVRGALRRCSASDAERGEDRRRGIGHGVARGHLSSEPEKAHIGVKPVDDQRDDYRHEQQRDKNHQRTMRRSTDRSRRSYWASCSRARLSASPLLSCTIADISPSSSRCCSAIA